MVADREGSLAAALPPGDRRPSAVAAALADAQTGLPEARSFAVADYAPRLQLEQVGQLALGAGASQFGTAIGGGVSFSFSDMLNTQMLATTVQVTQGLTGNTTGSDLGAQVLYLNQARRWYWGVVGGQVPYLSGGFEYGEVLQNGQVVGVARAVTTSGCRRSISAIRLWYMVMTSTRSMHPTVRRPVRGRARHSICLTGSRLGVANLELRVPLLRPFGVSRNMYGPLPI